MSEQDQPERSGVADGRWLTRERMLVLVLIVATALAFYVCYRLALPFLPAITWAVALAVVAHPLHIWIARRINSQNAAAGLAVTVVAVVIVAPGVFLVQQLVSQASRGLGAFKAQVGSGQWQSTVESNPQLARVLGWLGPSVDVRGMAERAADSVGHYLAPFVGGTLWTLGQLVITFFTLFYLL